ncbi:MAG: hypothetical protein Q7S43_03455 [bacterium]|nr:hypothetical protein [bacterium]
MNQNNEFLELLAKHTKLEDEMKKLAWQIAPDDIKYILLGGSGLLAYNKRAALEWLIKPKRQLEGKSPTETIINGKAEEVKRLLQGLTDGVYQ